MQWQPEDTSEERTRALEQLHGLAGAGRATLARLATDVRLVLANTAETRRLLAEEVYRVPGSWLDEVLRVRLATISPDRPSS